MQNLGLNPFSYHKYYIYLHKHTIDIQFFMFKVYGLNLFY